MEIRGNLFHETSEPTKVAYDLIHDKLTGFQQQGENTSGLANNLYSRKDTSTICGSYGWALHLTFFGTGPQAQVQIRLQKA